jgi:hypothetical protein
VVQQRPAAPWAGGTPGSTPSGLFPGSGRTRPTYREPNPVRGGSVAVGVAAGIVWLLLFALIDSSLRGYAYWTLLSGGAAWLVAAGLARFGDRGVAVGVAITTSVGWSVAAIAVAIGWALHGDWPLW